MGAEMNAEQAANNTMWGKLLNGEMRNFGRMRKLMSLLPADMCCKLCVVPFRGLAAPFMRLMNKRPSNKNPNMCNSCELMARTHPGGSEVEVSILFADVRGSTTMAEGMRPAEFSQLLNRFYREANKILIHNDAIIDKLVGDEVMALFVIGLAGSNHGQKALEAAERLLIVTGHKDNGNPWIPIGVGVHTGTAFIGSVGSTDNFTDFTALGDSVNTAARLVSRAGIGEILTTEETLLAAGREMTFLPRRLLELKGKSQPVAVRVIAV